MRPLLQHWQEIRSPNQIEKKKTVVFPYHNEKKSILQLVFFTFFWVGVFADGVGDTNWETFKLNELVAVCWISNGTVIIWSVTLKIFEIKHYVVFLCENENFLTDRSLIVSIANNRSVDSTRNLSSSRRSCDRIEFRYWSSIRWRQEHDLIEPSRFRNRAASRFYQRFAAPSEFGHQ